MDGRKLVDSPVISICSMDFQFRTVCTLLDMMIEHDFTQINCVDSTLLPYARNKLIRMAYERYPQFTHIVFIDDDMTGFTCEHIHALIDADVPIISGFVTTRRPPYTIVASFKDEGPEKLIRLMENETVVESPLIGMAFTAIKREVLEDTFEETASGPVWFTMDRSPRYDFEKEVESLIDEADVSCPEHVRKLVYQAVALGQNSHIGTELVGEDVAFCRKAEKFGHKTYIHCGVILGHIGNKDFNIKDAVRYAVEKEIARVQGIKSDLTHAVIG